MRYHQPRQWRAALPALLLLASTSASGADLSQSLAGRWQSASGEPFAMEWTVAGGGFDLRWSVPGNGQAEAAFRPSDRANVYVASGGEGWSMFRRREPVNPLLDGPLYWARATSDVVYVYRLTIDAEGAFVLDRYACRPADGKLVVDLLRRLPGSRTEEMQVTLARAEP